MFIVANRARKPINRLDDYLAALAAADEDALKIERHSHQAKTNVKLSKTRESPSAAMLKSIRPLIHRL